MQTLNIAKSIKNLVLLSGILIFLVGFVYKILTFFLLIETITKATMLIGILIFFLGLFVKLEVKPTKEMTFKKPRLAYSNGKFFNEHSSVNKEKSSHVVMLSMPDDIKKILTELGEKRGLDESEALSKALDNGIAIMKGYDEGAEIYIDGQRYRF